MNAINAKDQQWARYTHKVATATEFNYVVEDEARVDGLALSLTQVLDAVSSTCRGCDPMAYFVACRGGCPHDNSDHCCPGTPPANGPSSWKSAWCFRSRAEDIASDLEYEGSRRDNTMVSFVQRAARWPSTWDHVADEYI